MPLSNWTSVAYTICEITRGAENRAGAPSDFSTGLGEHGGALTPRHQLRPELMFELADLHGERGLTDRTFFRRPTEVPMSGQCVEIPKLPKGQHVDSYPGAISLDSDLIQFQRSWVSKFLIAVSVQFLSSDLSAEFTR